MTKWIFRGLATWLVVVLPAILGTALYTGAAGRNVAATILWALALTMFGSWFWTGVEIRVTQQMEAE